jgi:superfamily II DNA or RNA helicase
MIEKRITEQQLESGTIALTEREQSELGLPEHSTTIDVELESELFKAQWSGRGRQLTGDMLTERLQDYGQTGGLLRLRVVDGVYRLVLLPPGAAMEARTSFFSTTSKAKSEAARKAIKRRATVDRQFHDDVEYSWGTGSASGTGFLTEARRLLGEQLKAAGWDTRELVELRLQGEELATLDDFEELLAVDVANVDRMPHQEAVARHALSRMRGRAVLADEVGLGKTIEAGLAVKELTLRGLAKRVLILCPAPLREQWRDEMTSKFDLTFNVAYRGLDIRSQEKLVLSLTLATSNIAALTKEPWDIVIVDEAHRAAGAGAKKRRELITALTTACRYAFFLTATPVQNDLLELYRLIELLRPGTFTSVSQFKRQYMTRRDPRIPNDPAALRRLISSAMIRTTRAQAGVDRVVRRAKDVPVTLGPREQELYTLSTDLLRTVMRDPSDTMRRRSLALRLTASPFSMGTTALRMSERHGDERVRRVLKEVAHLAMDIQDSARENTAMKITKDWVREHGRVLIFTQHTDTVTGLLRRMTAQGLPARSFHGSMSPTERAATIGAFRSGEAPVMISTDAGAEGQNLQFCNCVLNFDLPWNPMRIEQRIGRVDRLTQPRDEVHIANLYARGTIDESVYRLLAEKLRMFELLFGQVTTILGELDDSKSASFETRVMEALFAESDTKMGHLLGELGTELADAREKASTLIAADSGLSSWMATAFEHRKGLTKAGATELAPEVTERARKRQRSVQTWVRKVLTELGTQIVHDTGDGDGAFLTVHFDEELADELGGRTVLHLAFDRIGMEHHPDAELCAVGSPVFEDLLGLLRMRGDLHATVPVIPEVDGASPYLHSASTTLLMRRLVPSEKWRGQATFRATVGETETAEHIITANIGGDGEVRLPRRPLQDGESLPAAFDVPARVVAEFEHAATVQLDKLRRERTDQIQRDQQTELKRVRDGYTAQIEEATYDDEVRLRRALTSEEQRLTRAPDVRSRAKLLAITLDEDDWTIEETWTGPGGAEKSLRYKWGLPAPAVLSVVSQGPIRVLALCSGEHFIDESERIHCSSCDLDRCTECGSAAILADCLVCGTDCCGECREATDGLCRRCAAPERAPEMDKEFSIAWRLNEDVVLHVGERSSELTHADQTAARLLVPDDDVHDPVRAKARSYAVANGLPADSGLALTELFSSHETNQLNSLLLRSTSFIATEFSIAATAPSAVNQAAVKHLPSSPNIRVQAASEFGVGAILEMLRAEVPPPSPPTTLVTRRPIFTDLELDVDRIVERISTVADDGTAQIVEERAVPLQWQESSDYATLATGELSNVRVSIERRNEAVLVTAKFLGTVSGERWIALPDGTSADLQLDWFDVLNELGTPGGRIGQRLDEEVELSGPFPKPTECELVDRHVESVVQLGDTSNDVALRPADESVLPPVEVLTPRDRSKLPTAVPEGLRRALLERTQRSFTTMVRSGFEVRETWQGHGTAVHSYESFDGRPVMPRLADIDVRGHDFGVCRDGHFYEVANAARCESCDTWVCRACDDFSHQATSPCGTCSANVCRRCASADHSVLASRCALCGDAACADCGRDPQVHSCAICARSVCSNCLHLNTCPTCSSLAPASDELLGNLPSDLAAAGAKVHAASDADATTVLINRGGPIEQAVLRHGVIERWVSFDRSEIDAAYALRIAASRKLSRQVIPIARNADPEPPLLTNYQLIASQRSFRAEWDAPELDEGGQADAVFAKTDGDLNQAVLAAFPASNRLPETMASMPEEVLYKATLMPDAQTTPLGLRWRRVGYDVYLTGSGLTQREHGGRVLAESHLTWSGDVDLPWVAEDWLPLPAIRASASVGSVNAVVVSMASLLAVGIRHDGKTKWYSVVSSPNAPAATTLARAAGLSDADEVSAYTDPAKIHRSTVLNATDAALTVDPMVEFAARPLDPGAIPITDQALAAWQPYAKLRVPDLAELPNELRLDLVRSFDHRPEHTAVRIGAVIEEVIKADRGQSWKFDLLLAPGDADARMFDSKSMRRRDSGVVDREGHFGSDDTRCPYCNDRMCTLCINGMSRCDCCGVAICRTCIREPHKDLWICPACDAMRPATRSEARQHGRFMFSGGMLIGTDDKHVVVVEQAKKSWARIDENGEKHLLPNPSLAGFLNERMSGRAENAKSSDG